MPHKRKTMASQMLLLAALLATPGLAQAKGADTAVNRGLEPIHQPVVERTDYVFDAQLSGNSLPVFEQGRLIGWFDAMDLGYGDRVSVSDAETGGAVREAVAGLVARYGLLLAHEAPATAGRSGPGRVRIVISRATADVPGCPNWSDRSETDFNNQSGANYGCAVNSNLAMMVADPLDLVEGRTTRSDLRVAAASRAIRTYQEKTPTGAGDLKKESSGGSN